MLPHEVVRQVNTSGAQPTARPHSRQIEPTTRATGRFTTNTGANVRRAFEEERPMISKAQVLRELPSSAQPQAQTPPPAMRGGPLSRAGAGLSSSYSHAAPLSPSKPPAGAHSQSLHRSVGGGGGDRSKTPPRVLGKTLINASNVLPDEVAAKASFLSLSVGALSASAVGPGGGRPYGGHRGGGLFSAANSNNTVHTSTAADAFDVSVERTSPPRAAQIPQQRASYTSGMRMGRTGSLLPGREDEVVLPGSTINRDGPDRSGFMPKGSPQLQRARSPPSPSRGGDSPTKAGAVCGLTGAAARPLTPPLSTMPVTSPSRGVRALQLVQQSRVSDHYGSSATATRSGTANGGLITDGRVGSNSSGANGGVVDTIVGHSSTGDVAEGNAFGASDVSMAQLLASYGATSLDCVSFECLGDDAAAEGFSVFELAATEGIEANLKTMALNEKPPANTFLSLVPPQMGCNEAVWIACTPGTGTQTRSVAVSGGSSNSGADHHSPPSPTKGSGATPSGGSDAPHHQHHLIIDLSAWPMIDRAPSIIVPALRHKATVADHGLDRCLQYHVTASNPTLFASGTPIVADPQRGMLTLVPNPNACGSATLTVFLEDAASVDPQTGEALRSAPVHLYVHTMRTENTAVCPASNGDGTPHPPLTSSLPAESLRKIISPTPSTFAAVPITAKAAVRCDPLTGATAFLPHPTALAAPPTSLHTPYAFPLPNLFEVREDSCLRDQLQGLLDRAQAASEAFDDATAGGNGNGNGANANGEAAATDLRFTGRLDCAFPFSTVLSPCFSSIATPFEVAAALLGPTVWRAPSLYSSAPPSTIAAVAEIAASIDDAALSTRLAAIIGNADGSSGSSPLFFEDEAKEAEVCALLERIADLRLVDGGAEASSDDTINGDLSPSQQAAVSAVEALTRRRAAAIGLSSMAEIGEKEAILQTSSVRPQSEEQAALLSKAEALVDSLLLASRCFAHYGRFVEALEAAEAAAKAADKYVGKDSRAHLAALIAVGTAAGLRGDFVGAARTLEGAADVSEMVCGAGSATTALTVMLLGAAYAQHGDITTGISFLQRTQRAFATILDSRASAASSPSVAVTANNDAPTLIATDVRLRAAIAAGLIAHYRSTVEFTAPGDEEGTTPPTEAEVDGWLHEVASAVTVAEDAVAAHARSQHDGEAEANSGTSPSAGAAYVDEALSASGRSAHIAVLHSIAATILLGKREARGLDHMAAAADALTRAADEAEAEGAAEAQSRLAAVRLLAEGSTADQQQQRRASGNGASSSPSLCSARLAPLKLHAAAMAASVVCARLTANDAFNAANGPDVEASLAAVGALCGDRHPIHSRLVALLGQLTRFSDEGIGASVHVAMLRTREAVRSVLCVPSIDAAVIASCCALTSLQQAEATVLPRPPTGPERAERLRLAVAFAEEACDAIASCDALFGNTYATEHTLRSVVEPACLAVFSAAHAPLPPLVVGRLERRIGALRTLRGDTSLSLVEPLLNFGTAAYLTGDYQSAHHFLAKSLKVADTINLIFLLGHLFRPAVHLTASQAQERNRVAADRLQIHQSAQFAAILFGIAGVYVAQGNADDAQSTYLQAQAALELAHMQTSLATSAILASLAKFLYSEGHYGDALAHTEKAAATLREFHLSVGSDSHNAYSVVPTAGRVALGRVDEVAAVIAERARAKGYTLCKQHDGRHRFVVYL